MRRAVVLVIALLVLGGCGSDGRTGAGSGSAVDRPTGSGLPTTVTAGGAYEGGVDIEVGVYVAEGKECFGSTARTREFELGGDGDDIDDMIATSVRIGDVNRIDVRHGEFFRPGTCGPWVREDGSRPRLPDPATRAGACVVLTGEDDLVQRAVGALEEAPAADQATRDGYEVQDLLMAVVYSRTPKLWDLAGEMVDYLDAPKYFVKNGKVTATVRETVAKIDALCGR